jgi:phospholipid transport system substrate-binding protein
MVIARRTFLGVVVTLLVAAVRPGAADAQSSGDDARRFIEGLAQRAITTVVDKQLPQNERVDHFRTLFVSSFDIPEIGRFVLSRYWRMATPEQQRDFLALFEEITVLTWAKRFADYNGERLETLDATQDGDRSWVVDSHIVKPQGPQNRVQWHVRLGSDGAFRVFDIVAEGVSMAITLRSDYVATMQINEGRLDGLLSSMRAKRDQLRNAG